MLEAAKAPLISKVEKNVSDILEERGVELDAITNIIWPHRHIDHRGHPSVFPACTNLVVGPGFRDAVGEGYPQNEDCACTSSAWEGRNLIELDFATGRRATRGGGWDAVDWLAAYSSFLRKDEFVLVAGHVCHRGGEYRPSRFRPIADKSAPDPRHPPFAGGVCLGSAMRGVEEGTKGATGGGRPF
ncbi:hypothetical protein DL767_009729 [Monosporascus sp. MG133]|nr:hypothetical protein DL767_009729 [Monosporascus sp. MG133]